MMNCSNPKATHNTILDDHSFKRNWITFLRVQQQLQRRRHVELLSQIRLHHLDHMNLLVLFSNDLHLLQDPMVRLQAVFVEVDQGDAVAQEGL